MYAGKIRRVVFQAQEVVDGILAAHIPHEGVGARPFRQSQSSAALRLEGFEHDFRYGRSPAAASEYRYFS